MLGIPPEAIRRGERMSQILFARGQLLEVLEATFMNGRGSALRCAVQPRGSPAR